MVRILRTIGNDNMRTVCRYVFTSKNAFEWASRCDGPEEETEAVRRRRSKQARGHRIGCVGTWFYNVLSFLLWHPIMATNNTKTLQGCAVPITSCSWLHFHFQIEYSPSRCLLLSLLLKVARSSGNRGGPGMTGRSL
jgi:hypothetical protein